MGRENGLELTFTPIEKKTELDENCMKILSEKLNTFLEEENLDDILREGNAQEIRAKYNYNRFHGGPSFILNQNPDNIPENTTKEEMYWDLFIAQGPTKSVKMQLNKNFNIQNIKHDFNEEAYRTEIILGWFDGVFNSIKVAQKKHAFTWEIKY